jgi:hypothetical protein
MIHRSCSFVSGIERQQLEDYVRELEVAVFSFDESATMTPKALMWWIWLSGH